MTFRGQTLEGPALAFELCLSFAALETTLRQSSRSAVSTQCQNTGHTLQKGYQIPERSVMNIPRPFFQDDTVLTVELDRLGICVNNDHLCEGPVQVRQILGEEEEEEGERYEGKMVRGREAGRERPASENTV